MKLDRCEVAQQAREESEEGLLLEVRAEFFMRVGENEDDNREHLRHVVDLGLVIVGSGGIGVVLDHERDELRKGVDGLEDTGGGCSTSRLVLDVAVDTDFGANAEEERRYLLSVEDALLLELDNKVDERLLDVVRLLVESDPFGEAERELLAHGRLVDGGLRN